MMKFLKNQWLTILAALGGVVMLLLRQIHLATINERGLLASFHYAGIITGILALLIPGILLWRCLVLAKGNTCKEDPSHTKRDTLDLNSAEHDTYGNNNCQEEYRVGD
jgi:hypothetical protein